MGKNQQHKAMQAARSDAAEGGVVDEEAGADVSFHTAEWHAARVAALTTERLNWEDWKKQQKEIAAKAALAADEEEKQMQEYRAQLDADRQNRLSKGVNNANLRQEKKASKKSKAGKKSKKSKREKKSKKRASTSSDSSESDSSPRRKKKRKRKKDGTDSDSSSGKRHKHSKKTPQILTDGPVRLSDFLRDD